MKFDSTSPKTFPHFLQTNLSFKTSPSYSLLILLSQHLRTLPTPIFSYFNILALHLAHLIVNIKNPPQKVKLVTIYIFITED